MLALVLAVAVVIVTSAMCSLFEAALYSLPASHVERMVEKGRTSGKILKRLRDKVEQPITAILSLNTIANTAGASVAGALALVALGEHWLVYFSAAFTAGILFFSEVLPKTAGVVYARPLARFIAWPIQILVWIFIPIIWMVSLGTRLIAGKSSPSLVAPEELVVMARMGLKSGSIREDEAAVIQNILSLRSKTVNDVLTPRSVLFSLNADTTVKEASVDPRINAHTRVPIYISEPEEIAGIIHRRDIYSAMSSGKEDSKLSDLMNPIHFVLEKSSLDKVLKLFLDKGQHMFVVYDEFGGLDGVITLEDVLEEILGKEIVDEFDEVTDMRELAKRRREKLLKSNTKPPKREKPSL